MPLPELLTEVDGEWAAEQVLLLADPANAWYGDLERISAGGNGYVDFLEDLSSISGGAFTPREISERWNPDWIEGADGPAAISFMHGDRAVSFVHESGDYVDLRLLARLDALSARGWDFWDL